MTSDSGPADYVVIDDAEENGFARLVEQRTCQDAHADLFVLESREAVRLRVGDRVIGQSRGRQVTEVHIVARAQPPGELRASVATLVNALQETGIEISVSAEFIADREWRRDSRQMRGSHPYLRSLVLPQLTFLFRWHDTHPLDDGKVTERLTEVMRSFVPGFVVTAECDEEGDLKSFRVHPSGPEIGVGDGDWERPKGCYAPLVQLANKRLSTAGASARWMDVRDDWLLATPATYQLLVQSGLVDAPE